ncbi:MAG: response regulator [Balneolaceae bacterium]|nr:response regulator [Balneolaceae bacterium]
MSSVKNICIIDDDRIYTYGASKVIKDYMPENNVISFESGQAAIESMGNMRQSDQELPDVILLDINMPKMNGWDFLQKLKPFRKSVEKEMKVFVISSYIKKHKEELYRVEWDDQVSEFIPKPVTPDTLKSLLT